MGWASLRSGGVSGEVIICGGGVSGFKRNH